MFKNNCFSMLFTKESVDREKRENIEFYRRAYELQQKHSDLRMIPYLSRELGYYRLNYRF